MGLLRAKNGLIDQRFLLYAYIGPQFQEILRSRTIHGSTVDRLPLIDMPQFPLTFPSDRDEQRRIAHILGTLDDKIEQNRRMNATLEAMAQALFRSWFVDFDPVWAKAEGREPTGMDAETAALFPNEFEESEFGEIPKGWEVKTLGEICEIIDCLHAKKPEIVPSGKLFLQLANIRNDGLLDLAERFLISDQDYSLWTSRIEVREGDCVITNVGRVGAVSQIPPNVTAAMGRNMTSMRLKSECPYPTFLIQLLLSSAMESEIEKCIDSGTILDALNVRNIPRLRFACPNAGLLAKFEQLARPMRARMEENLKESSGLGAVRDALLPRLLSGELSVTADDVSVACDAGET
jgi:type I restriction enzyme S subunit